MSLPLLLLLQMEVGFNKLLQSLVHGMADAHRRKEWLEACSQLVQSCISAVQGQDSSTSSNPSATAAALQKQLQEAQEQLKRGLPATCPADALATGLRELFQETWALEEPRALALAAECQAKEWAQYEEQLNLAEAGWDKYMQLQGEMEEVRAGAEAVTAAAEVWKQEKAALEQKVQRLNGEMADLKPWKEVREKVANQVAGQGRKWLERQQCFQQQEAWSDWWEKASDSEFDQRIEELDKFIDELMCMADTDPQMRKHYARMDAADARKEQRLREQSQLSSNNVNSRGTADGSCSRKEGRSKIISSRRGGSTSCGGTRSPSWSSADGVVVCSISLGGVKTLRDSKAT
jgi:hypothetical protein